MTEVRDEGGSMTFGAWWVSWLVALTGAGTAGEDPAACQQLGRLDVQRAVAMTAHDHDRLVAVYADPAQADADVRLVRSYDERGLRLHVGPMIRLRCAVLMQRPEVVRLDVLDRLGPTWVTTRDGDRTDLPVDRPDRHLIELRLVSGSWRIAEVSDRG